MQFADVKEEESKVSSSSKYGEYADMWHLNTDEIIKILNSEIFENINNTTLNHHQHAIITYFEEQKIDGRKIMSTSLKAFKASIIEYCGNDKKLNGPLNKLRRKLIDYKSPNPVDNETQDNPSSSWEEKFNQLLQENKKLQKKNKEIETKFEEYKKKQNMDSPTRIEHSRGFWLDIKWRLDIRDTDSIKSMIKNKEMTIYDEDYSGQTILWLAAWKGCYELCKFCINAGADVEHKCQKGTKPIQQAAAQGYYDVEKLLLFAQMNLNVGNELKDLSQEIIKQNGINKTILQELALISGQSNNESLVFEKMMLKLMINIIDNRSVFSDIHLNFCWDVASKNGKNPLKSDLWKTLKTVCVEIIAKGSKKDWYWMKKLVLPSTIWYRDISKWRGNGNEAQVLYFELLELAESGSSNQVRELTNDLKQLEKKQQNNWNELIKWDPKLPRRFERRQDKIPNGIVSQYTYNKLTESSESTFNSPNFYDYNQYLSQLVLLAHVVNDEFQQSVQTMFNIDKETHQGRLPALNDADLKRDGSDDSADGFVKYGEGPVKLIERARAKAQGDYAEEPYPASACITDLNRCSLYFNDISTLLRALKLFTRKVHSYDSGNIIGIIRTKNGFIKYAEGGSGYADVKLNVLIRGDHNNIIGEVQFLLNVMKQFKDKEHDLYDIKRRETTIRDSVSPALPILLDVDKRLFSAALSGSVNKINKLLVMDGMTKESIMKTDPYSQTTILHALCKKNQTNSIKYLKEIIDNNDKFLEYLFQPDEYNTTPIQLAIECTSTTSIEEIFETDGVKERYLKDMDLQYKAMYSFCSYSRDLKLMDYLLRVMGLTSKEKLIKILKHKIAPPKEGRFNKNAAKYHRNKIVHHAASKNTLDVLKKLEQLIGSDGLIEMIFSLDDYNYNVLEKAIRFGRQECIEYILELEGVKDKYIEDDKLLWRLLYICFCKTGDAKRRQFILDKFKDVRARFTELISKRYNGSDGKFGKGAIQYENRSIVEQMMYQRGIADLEALCCYVGEKAFCNGALLRDHWGDNAIMTGIEEKKLEMIKYMWSVNTIREKCMNDVDVLHDIIKRLSDKFDISIGECIIHSLRVDKEKITELKKKYKDFETEEISKLVK